MTVRTEKKTIRLKMCALLAHLSDEKKLSAGIKVANHLAAWLPSSLNEPVLSIAFFKSLSDEITTNALDEVFLNLGIRRFIALKGTEKNLSFLQLKEDQKLESLDFLTLCAENNAHNFNLNFSIIFVPGLAFDRYGYRLGRGFGYYDRGLASLNLRAMNRPLLIGLAMDEQILSKVPHEDHDIPMDYLCTPNLGVVKTRWSL